MWRVYTSLAASFRLWDRIENEIKTHRCLAHAAQHCADVLFSQLIDSLALVRIFATVRFYELSGFERMKCIEHAAAHGADRGLTGKTNVLSLMGTRGAREQWNDRRESRDHLGIPLVSASFTESIPMIATLMKEIGIGTDWIDIEEPHIIVHNRGRTAGMFYVDDARTAVDAKGRLVVPAQQFVETENLKTVFGVGGAYPNGTFISIVFFTRMTLTRLDIERFLPLVHAFKAGTMKIVSARSFFEAAELPPVEVA